ncbi:hypothetical protein LX99_02672 [Mucilaginibacter oryzae]|uniref:DUF4369 domain-containing protein n=1 Tax=Mucilaginibacter oryzae TaxID=468058 RepID=A0A316HBK4_9SPHI|nr:hypothetical protein [Mucilaginibacter oryzae]PWK77787.1 hypothetical protein LX99_02672 [Mucilaginibacter oryzae]
MIKSVFILLLALFFTGGVRAQKSFSVTIKLDSGINPQKVRYRYYNGSGTVLLPDTFGNRQIILLKDQYYSPLASFNVSYNDGPKTYYSNDFFVDNKPAIISLYFKPNDDDQLLYSTLINATPVYDTVANKTWSELQTFMADQSVARENQAFDDFLNQNKGFARNDSLKRIFNGFYKRRLNRTMLFLKRYADDYFSFWYFIQQVAQVGSVLKDDKPYLKQQLAYIKAVFPAKFTASFEGERLIKAYEDAVK